MFGIKKKIGAALIGSACAASAVMALPSKAMALGWDPQSMVAQTTGTTGMTAANINQQSLANWVQNFTTFILGIAIVLFVLKVVLTAIDRMVLQNNTGEAKTNGETILTKLPIIGAYKDASWKEVFIHFGKNIAIVAGAWVLVQIVVGVILFVFGTITNGVA